MKGITKDKAEMVKKLSKTRKAAKDFSPIALLAACKYNDNDDDDDDIETKFLASTC